jgi:flavin reductase (DIM6/NTAB) family NADH-FMN oxidoreductase RutF
MQATQQEAALDLKVLRSALGSFPTGVAIITTRGSVGEPVGLTCNSFNSVSLDPPLVSWGLRLASSNLEAFQLAPAFTINILADHQKDLSARFASRDPGDKFHGIAWREGLGGAPVIEGCVASFQCEKFAGHIAGDHMLFLGKVIHFENQGREDSLVFYKGAYKMVAESLSELAASCRVDAADLQYARRVINCDLVKLACQNVTPEDLEAIESNIRQLEKEVHAGDIETRNAVSMEFFRLIARAAHNEVLMAVSESLANVLRQVVKSAGPSLRFSAELVPARKRILACLRARDTASAEREMADLFRETAHLEQAPQAAGSKSKPGV